MGRETGVRRYVRAADLTLLLLAGCAAPAEPAPEEMPPPAEAPVEEPAAEVPAEPESPEEEPADTDFVRVKDYIPGIIVDLRYATADNFCGQAVYDFSEACLRYGTVKKLSAAQTARISPASSQT